MLSAFALTPAHTCRTPQRTDRASIAGVTRERILAEIRRTAEANGGRPLGIDRFAAETGIREHDWRGRYWVRWSDALEAAGYAPNQLTPRYDDDQALARLVAEIRRLGRMPTDSERNLIRRQDESFPSASVFRRLGSKRDLARQVVAYCQPRPECQDVIGMVASLLDDAPAPSDADTDDSEDAGFVYLLKSGRHYKIGWTRDVGRRQYDLKIQLPEAATEVHVIATDDPLGIERYWHDRFSDRRKNGEWFELTRADVAAFRRRKYM